jgi:FtsZ-binding cell division protein ZapB
MREQIGEGFPESKEPEMTNSKLQAALDELERLHRTVKEFKERNGTLPNPDSDAGRALSLMESFNAEYRKLNIDKLLKQET